MNIDHPVEWISIPLPNTPTIRLRCTATTMAITVNHRVRYWWFWRRWRTDVLAETVYAPRVNDNVVFSQVGDMFLVTVNGDVKLTYDRP